MSRTLTTAIPRQQPIKIDWAAIGERLVAEFPDRPAVDVLTELVHAHDAAVFVGTAESELAEVVGLMASYAMKVHSGEVIPSSRLDPETHASWHRAEECA